MSARLEAWNKNIFSIVINLEMIRFYYGEWWSIAVGGVLLCVNQWVRAAPALYLASRAATPEPLRAPAALCRRAGHSWRCWGTAATADAVRTHSGAQRA